MPLGTDLNLWDALPPYEERAAIARKENSHAVGGHLR